MVNVCVSGYFDPLHVGHLDYINKASKLGDKLIVIVNNDAQSELKKGKSFMKDTERCEIMRNIKAVDFVVLSSDKDRSVCKTLEQVNPDIFCNGGDQSNDCLEKEVCEKLNIKMVDELGDKIQSSSWLTEKN